MSNDGNAAGGCFIFCAIIGGLALMPMLIPTSFGCAVALLFPLALFILFPFMVDKWNHPWE